MTIYKKSLLRNVSVAIAAFLISLGAAEAVLRVAYPASDRHFVLPRNELLTLTPLEEHVPGVASTAVYQTSSLGIRGAELSDSDDYRILAIGGSTTQNGYLDQSSTWTLQLGARLNDLSDSIQVWSGDVGRSGHTARSHVLQLEALLTELPPIDAVVMLVGVNDLTVALRHGYDYEAPLPLDDSGALAAQVREAFVLTPGRLHERNPLYRAEGVTPLKRTAIYQLLRQVKDGVVRARGGTQQDRFGEIYETWRHNRSVASEWLDSVPDLMSQLEVYEGYLTRMVEFADARGVRLVLVTQPTLWRSDLSEDEEARLWLGGVGDFQSEPGQPYFTPAVLKVVMDSYNATLLKTCERYQLGCVDLAAVMPTDTTMFYDDVHFTERGSRFVAETLAQHFLQRGLIAPAKR